MEAFPGPLPDFFVLPFLNISEIFSFFFSLVADSSLASSPAFEKVAPFFDYAFSHAPFLLGFPSVLF